MPDCNYAIIKVILLAWLSIVAIAMFNDDNSAFDPFLVSPSSSHLICLVKRLSSLLYESERPRTV